jgi:hypothetical protein
VLFTEISKEKMSDCAQLVKLLDFNLSNKKIEETKSLFENEKHEKVLLASYSDVLQVVMRHLTGENYEKEPEVYEICEGIIKILSEKCHQEGILFEFLEIIEEVKNDDVFISLLKGMQVIILKQTDKKSRALEYCLNAVEHYVSELPFPDTLKKNMEEEEEKLLEMNEQVRRILMMYITLSLFYEPIVKQIGETKSSGIFRTVRANRRNVMACFILNLLGPPLAFLNLAETGKAKTYSRQCAETLVQSMSNVFGDLYFLLQYAERRIRWPDKDVEEYNYDVKDVFLLPEKAPLLQMGILFYLVIAENIQPKDLPKIYSPIYIFNMGIYLVNELIKSNEVLINFKGLKLCFRMLENIWGKLESDELDLAIHRAFCENLMKLLTYSSSKRNRKIGLMVLKIYILKFDDLGRYLIIKNLLKTTNHKGIQGYLTTIYKDILFEELKKEESSTVICQDNFKFLVQKHFCRLENGAETDLMENSDVIISSLNFLVAFLIRDKENRTKICELIPEIRANFLEPLRVGLDMSRAHYKNEVSNVKLGKSSDDNLESMIENTEILNGDKIPSVTTEKKIEMLSCALNSFDIIDSLLARVNDIVDGLKKK